MEVSSLLHQAGLNPVQHQFGSFCNIHHLFMKTVQDVPYCPNYNWHDVTPYAMYPSLKDVSKNVPLLFELSLCINRFPALQPPMLCSKRGACIYQKNYTWMISAATNRVECPLCLQRSDGASERQRAYRNRYC